MKTVRAAFLCFAIVSISANQSWAANGPDTEVLSRAVETAIRDDFDFVSQRVARDEYDRFWLLAEIRPRKAGFFVVRYEVDIDDPGTFGLKQTGLQNEFYLRVAEAGTPRVINTRYPGGAFPREADMHPLACAGDTLVLPIQLQANFSNYRFFNTSAQLRAAKIYEEFDRAAQEDIPKAYTINPTPSSFDNKLEDHLILRGVGKGKEVSEAGDFAVHSMKGLFEARSPGDFGIRVTSDKQASADVISFRVVPKTKAISVPVIHWHEIMFNEKGKTDGTKDFAWWKPTGTLIAREGDFVTIDLRRKRTNATDDVAVPSIRIDQAPFDYQPGPLEFPAEQTANK